MEFKTIIKLTEEQAREYLEQIRWPQGAVCPHCGDKQVIKLNNVASSGRKRREGLYKCRICRKQFTVTCGTIFEGSHASIKTWMLAYSLMCASKKGVSAHQVHRMLGITYKTAWFMCHRIRYAMSQEPLKSALAGTVEVDECFIGGLPANQKKLMGNPKYANKTPVVALVERGGRVRAYVTRYVTANNVNFFIGKNISKNAILNTDEGKVYKWSGRLVGKHETVNHSILEFARGDTTTNHVENFFSLLKRGIIGSFHHVSPWHLQRYCDEFTYRYSLRKSDDSDRTTAALSRMEGKRLLYKTPIKKVA
ncbi:MAG: IS1595 family transposase [Chitinispirillaceae bacterium]|nr:IS1595 family transposase [Chitinispirillaceae bacterium]